VTERPREACFVFDYRPALFTKSQNCISDTPYGGIRGNINALSEIFKQRNFLSEFYPKNVSFIRKTAK